MKIAPQLDRVAPQLPKWEAKLHLKKNMKFSGLLTLPYLRKSPGACCSDLFRWNNQPNTSSEPNILCKQVAASRGLTRVALICLDTRQILGWSPSRGAPTFWLISLWFFPPLILTEIPLLTVLEFSRIASQFATQKRGTAIHY